MATMNKIREQNIISKPKIKVILRKCPSFCDLARRNIPAYQLPDSSHTGPRDVIAEIAADLEMHSLEVRTESIGELSMYTVFLWL